MAQHWGHAAEANDRVQGWPLEVALGSGGRALPCPSGCRWLLHRAGFRVLCCGWGLVSEVEVSWEELRCKREAQLWVKGTKWPLDPGQVLGRDPRRCSSTLVVCKRALGKCWRVEMGTCQAGMEPGSSHTARSGHHAAPMAGKTGGDGTCTPKPAMAGRSWVGAGSILAGACKAGAGLSHSAVEAAQPVLGMKSLQLVTDF